jgi:adenylate cyclase
LLISETTYEQVEKQVTIGRRVEVELPGKSGKYPLYEVLEISALPFSPKPIPQRRNNWFAQLLGGLIKKLLAIYFRVMRRNPKKK